MSKQHSLEKLIKITQEILQVKYPSAKFAFLAGSIVRGEATAFSDLDIVVIFKELPNAYRESFYFQGFPVETFVHTAETLNYFFEEDAKSGVPSLPQMVAEGIEVPSKCELSEKLKNLANEILNNPPKISDEELRIYQYWITDLIDDIREPRSKLELTAVGTRLYEVIATCYLQTNGFWSAKGKSIPRNLIKHNPYFYQKFTESFEELFVNGKTEKVIKLAEKLLEKHGGFMFDGIRLDAPPEWKKEVK
jgi:Nucleotidyltransferase domain